MARLILMLLLLALPGLASPGWRYQVKPSADLARLEVEARLSTGGELTLLAPGVPYVRNLERKVGNRWVAVRDWKVPDAAHLRYTFELARAARELNRPKLISWHDGVVLCTPSVWLVRPVVAGDARYEFTVAGGPGFASGVWRAPGGGYGGLGRQLDHAPQVVLGAVARRELPVPGGVVELVYLPGRLQLGDEELVRWVSLTARAVAGYFGRFPVQRVLLAVLPQDEKPLSAFTFGNGGASIALLPSRGMSAARLREGWELCHELVHLGVPALAARYHWLEEGIATYVEPLIRARMGEITPAEVWGSMVRGLPDGQPRVGDGGLDGTESWGRTYWGGAGFCLLADLAIRQQTGNRRSFDDALRAWVAEGGSVAVDWPFARALAVADRATGTRVLTQLHRRMGARPVPLALDDLWSRLGVVRTGPRAVRLVEGPLAGLRDSIHGGPSLAARASGESRD